MIRLIIPQIDTREIQSVKKILQSGYLVQGAHVSAFEEKVAQFLNVRETIAVSSGTAALHLALMALDIREGDEVILPAFTYPATINVIEQLKARPVLVDIDLKTYNMDVSQIENKITKKTKVIMPVHLFGYPVDMAPVQKLAKRHRLYVVEDAACALGAMWRGRACGTIGDIGCFSFHPRKVITTGEGGLLVAKSGKLIRKIRALRNHGTQKVKGKICFTQVGLNYRMTEMQAAIGLEQMKKISHIIKAKRNIAVQYAALFKPVSWIQIPSDPEHQHIYQSYVLYLKNKSRRRDALIKFLHKRGVESTIGTYALHELDYYKNKYSWAAEDFIYAKKAFQGTITLPIYPGLKEKELKIIQKGFLDF